MIGETPSFEFRSLTFDQHRQFVIVQVIRFHNLAIEHDIRGVAIDDRGDSQFRISRGAHLTDDEQVQRSAKGLRYLQSDRNATTWQCEYNWLLKD